MAKSKPECLIDVELAAAINELLYVAVGDHPNPGFRCPQCHELVSPYHGPKQRGDHFEHLEAKGCSGPDSWKR